MVSAYVQKLYAEESWKVDHDNAMYCRNVEMAIAVGLKILRDIERLTEGDRPTVSDGLRQAESFRWWLSESRKVIMAIEELTGLDYDVDGASEFSRKFNDLHLVSGCISETIESLRGIISGKVTRLDPNDLRCR